MVRRARAGRLGAMNPTDILPADAVTKYRMGQTEVTALRRVEFSVGHTEFLAVMGLSGSGKTTFLNSLSGLDDTGGGTVAVDGEDSHMSDARPAEDRAYYGGGDGTEHRAVDAGRRRRRREPAHRRAGARLQQARRRRHQGTVGLAATAAIGVFVAAPAASVLLSALVQRRRGARL
jgi:energy-coupling factor transporter ATP-binding protein EcfA2